jgi:hypothetical protein
MVSRRIPGGGESIMKHEYIKYEKLSGDIKNEIAQFHKTEMERNAAATMDESMAKWFEQKFDEWLNRKFMPKGDTGRRRHFRLNVEVPIRIIDTLIESSKEDSHAIEFVGKIVNISRGGLYFKYHEPIEVSSIIQVLIALSDIDSDLSDVEALAMVIRTDRLNDKEYGIGIMFSSIYDTSKNSLELFILKNLSYYIYSE